MPTHMLPLSKKAIPPNIFFSASPLRRPSAPRMRSANRSSKAMPPHSPGGGPRLVHVRPHPAIRPPRPDPRDHHWSDRGPAVFPMNRLLNAHHLEDGIATDDMDLPVQDLILSRLARLSDAPVPPAHRRELLVAARAEDLTLADDAEVGSAPALL